MTFTYPVEGFDAFKLYEQNETGPSGFFPIGPLNFWHGGINLYFPDADTGAKPVRAVARGTIIAYRFTKEYCKLEKRYKETTKEGDKQVPFFRKEFSHNFVLIEHTLKTPNEQPVIFYSLYMHLLPFGAYDEKYDKKEVSLFKRWRCEVKEEPDGAGDNLRDQDGKILKVIPKGVEVTADPDAGPYKGGGDSSRRLGVICSFFKEEVKGYIWLPSFERIGETDRYRCIKAVTKDKAEKGLAVYEEGNTASSVVKLLRKGTEIFFVHPHRAVNKEGKVQTSILEIKLKVDSPAIGYIRVDKDRIEAKEKVIDPVLGDNVQSCKIEVGAGEILGWPGNEGTAEHNAFHFEIFTKKDNLFGDKGFWNNIKEDGKEGNVLKIEADTPLYSRRLASLKKDKILPQHAVVELVNDPSSLGKHPLVNARHIKSVDSETGWVLRSELDWQEETGNNPNEAKYHLAGPTLKWFWNETNHAI